MNRAGGERGATAVAYAVMIAIIALLLVGAVFALGGSLENAFTGGADCIVSPGSCEDSPGGGGDGGGDDGGGDGGSPTTTTNPPGTTTTTTVAA